MSTPAASSIRYLEAPPRGVSQATQEALAPFTVHWSEAPAGCLVEAGVWREVFAALKQAGFNLLRDHTAVDYPERSPRFTVVASLVNLDTQEELLVKTRVAEGEAPASLVPLWHSADWAERETYDMFGIPFAGHPNLTRIYMPEDYEGWPMRRDFPLRGHLRFVD